MDKKITDPYPKELAEFIEKWNDNSSTITIYTSGSTGKPKAWTVEKKKMEASANTTIQFLNLKAGQNALLCLPTNYIAGMMMVVRSIIANLELISVIPSSNPLKSVDDTIHFAAMTPMQVFNSLQDPIEYERLKKIHKLIIGGSPITPSLSESLKSFPNEIYSTYGMTETLSHIALRRINSTNSSEYYTPLPSVELSLNPIDQTLIIYAPHVHSSPLQTNDIAELLPDGRFNILGRVDNVINSGGVKIQLEKVEDLISAFLRDRNYAFTSQKDPKYGERLVLLIGADNDMDVELEMDVLDETLHNILKKHLPKHQIPKKVYFISKIPRTRNGKINRIEAKLIAENLS